MFTIEEARISRPSATRRIPRGVTFEYSQENVLRALEERDRAAEQERARFLSRQINWVVRAVVTTVANLAGASQPTVATGQDGSD